MLTFYGKGELKRADYSLRIEKDCIKKIVIGEGITSLGKNSFTYFPNAKKVILPSSGAKDNKVMGEITNLDRGKIYYFEFRTWEDHQSEIDSWMGKRKIQVN